jgi:SAM-dependent methyltransferase
MTEVSDRNQKTWHSWLAAHSYRKADGLFPAEERILGRLGPTLQSARLLDVGIGTGRTTASLAGRVKQYVGVDYSPTMLTLARSRFPHADLRLADARKLTEDFGQAQFDLVLFSFNGIDGVDHDDRLRILDGIRQVLVPDGILIFSTHNVRNRERVPSRAPISTSAGRPTSSRAA